MQNPFKKRRIREFLSITLLGFAIAFAICTECFLSFESLQSSWRSVLLSVLYTYILGYGCTYIIARVEGRYSWLEQPAKKFLLHFLSLASFSFVVSSLLYFVYAMLFYNGQNWLTLNEVLSHAKLPVFISVSIATFFTGTGFLRSWKQEAIRAERLEKEKIATQYESLRNQVNPHFLFNSLNALSELVYEDQDLAVKYIRQLSQVYRYVLDSRNSEVVSLQEELDFIESFVFLQKIRFGENLQVNIDVERNRSKYILPLSLQIIMENAIKHNVVSEEEPLSIRISEEKNYLVISNPINGKSSLEPGTGIGLKNIEMRYKYLTEIPVLVSKQNGQFVAKIPILTEN